MFLPKSFRDKAWNSICFASSFWLRRYLLQVRGSRSSVCNLRFDAALPLPSRVDHSWELWGSNMYEPAAINAFTDKKTPQRVHEKPFAAIAVVIVEDNASCQLQIHCICRPAVINDGVSTPT